MQDRLPLVESGPTNSRQLIAFYIPLLWPLGLPSITRFTLIRDEVIPWASDVMWPDWLNQVRDPTDRNFVTLSFHRHSHQQVFDTRLLDYATRLSMTPDQLAQHEIHGVKEELTLPTSNTPATIVEAVTPLFELPDDERDPVTAAFERCIDELNTLEISYLMTSGDLRVRRTNRVTAFPSIPYVLLDPETEDQSHPGLFMVNHGAHLIPYEVKDLAHEQIQGLVTRLSLFKKGQPLLIYAERMISARRALELDGDCAAAAIWCHTAGEVFFDTTLLMMVWEELNYHSQPKATLDQVVAWFSVRASLEARLYRHYHGRLQGGWDPAKPGTPLFRWINEVGRLRNQAVHAGYQPTEREAREALAIMEEAEGYVKDTLADDRNRTRYPRTAAMVVSKPGLERRGAYRGKIRRLVTDDREVDWTRSFAEFRRCFIGQLDAALRGGQGAAL